MLETLASTIRSDNDIRGIMVDGQEIKFGLFADDLTEFLKNDKSLRKFLEQIYPWLQLRCKKAAYQDSGFL